MNTYILVGGAGFIGSHFAQRILGFKDVKVTIIDNEISGSKDNLSRLDILSAKNMTYIQEDIMSMNEKNLDLNNSILVNFAANPDISLSNVQPTIDFDRGTVVHNHVLELCRIGKAKQLIFTSGSGVYGDMSSKVLNEDLGNLNVCSPYGANKLACEALSLAYSSMFNFELRILRFGNVVGLNQTHGVGYDFIRKLINDPEKLVVLGDGHQSKPYIYIDDVVEALFHVSSLEGNSLIANAASPDFISVRQIAKIVIDELGLDECKVEYGETPYGWKGDVPVIRLDSSFLESTGWKCNYNSFQAIQASVKDMVKRFI